jgi:hypothetical protein
MTFVTDGVQQHGYANTARALEALSSAMGSAYVASAVSAGDTWWVMLDGGGFFIATDDRNDIRAERWVAEISACDHAGFVRNATVRADS